MFVLALLTTEDDDPEWRGLDYSVEVGKPPVTLCEFVRQYDCTLYSSNWCKAAQSKFHLD